LAFEQLLTSFVLLWAVIDPIGKVRIAKIASGTAAAILLFFLVAGEILLRLMGVPLLAFQVAGGLILFLFALAMIFGESKPEEEIRISRSLEESAIYPLATPSLASPGAILAGVLLTENSRHSIPDQAATAGIMLIVVAAAHLMMRLAERISGITVALAPACSVESWNS
jgi:multiple antibiotic resistance protein